ncbi:hypothetical protein PR202_ga15207 [Eleusine coracana subsp. coracana]|uniref:Peroxidase n=1 Tax=Eleusine coracana subsp. coracana TaxID=191504 RepID=A0AAV5CJJ3_ELECO|nr:hypothetical protein PR202_ga15207 [Eleusine coracana subsp. coracana]
MASFTSRSTTLIALAVVLAVLGGAAAQQQLSATFYAKSCPNLASIVRRGMAAAVQKERRMRDGRVHPPHGCDGSILLDGTNSEKAAGPNANSVRGYEVIDAIKTQVEASCRATVSCSDILALAARDGVNLLGGPTWNVPLGRKDSRTASQSAANSNLPGPGSSLATLKTMFSNKGLNARDMTALSGAHTIGRSQCQFFRNRIYNERNINATFARLRQQTCPRSGGNGNLAPFDVTTADTFDNAYYKNLVQRRGLLHSDQELFNGGSQDALVKQYGTNPGQFNADFITAMIKMGNLKPAVGTRTEVRRNCRRPN